METLIIICLLMIIILLLHDQRGRKKPGDIDVGQKEGIQDQINLVGLPKPDQRRGKLIQAEEDIKNEPAVQAISADQQLAEIQQHMEADMNEDFPDLADEEEWAYHGEPNGDLDYATGVTFEELTSVGMFLQKENSEQAQLETAATVVHKIQGTELFSLLENSTEGASKKIAELLDKSHFSSRESASSIVRDENLNRFDIGDFV